MIVAAPVAAIRSELPPLSISTSYVEPGSNTTVPVTFIVPMELPGATVAPELAAIDPTVPLPPKRPPLPTVIAPP
ncbi:hypothetical protein [Breoghania sp. L-A4]|uniref:hypothetical protein n=1 Tax=Breoghania sp. L-A4 TaxID=2304600 RepID=UPI000E35974F|nr:hypothetical protein [Breoghania sp. L-A4]AXS40237.1 hypothetical protein D1F64_09410 [Breoghania sp. L-A4]